MDFEFYPDKSRANKIKHGIDFVEAQRLWEDKGAVSISAAFSIEARCASIARLGQRYWAAIYTVIDNSARLISVREAREMEKWYCEDHYSR